MALIHLDLATVELALKLVEQGNLHIAERMQLVQDLKAASGKPFDKTTQLQIAYVKGMEDLRSKLTPMGYLAEYRPAPFATKYQWYPEIAGIYADTCLAIHKIFKVEP